MIFNQFAFIFVAFYLIIRLFGHSTRFLYAFLVARQCVCVCVLILATVFNVVAIFLAISFIFKERRRHLN